MEWTAEMTSRSALGDETRQSSQFEQQNSRPSHICATGPTPENNSLARQRQR